MFMKNEQFDENRVSAKFESEAIDEDIDEEDEDEEYYDDLDDDWEDEKDYEEDEFFIDERCPNVSESCWAMGCNNCSLYDDIEDLK